MDVDCTVQRSNFSNSVSVCRRVLKYFSSNFPLLTNPPTPLVLNVSVSFSNCCSSWRQRKKKFARRTHTKHNASFRAHLASKHEAQPHYPTDQQRGSHFRLHVRTYALVDLPCSSQSVSRVFSFTQSATREGTGPSPAHLYMCFTVDSADDATSSYRTRR